MGTRPESPRHRSIPNLGGHLIRTDRHRSRPFCDSCARWWSTPGRCRSRRRQWSTRKTPFGPRRRSRDPAARGTSCRQVATQGTRGVPGEKGRREGDEILELARARAERLVQRTEVVRTAEQRARQLVETAREGTRRMRERPRTTAIRNWPASRASWAPPVTPSPRVAGASRRPCWTGIENGGAPEAAEAERAVERPTRRARPPSTRTAFFDQDAEGT
ncbi:MAG: hypothetical protein Ct9H300mP12_11060 [Acidimicrobiales bacterium]|nr:MAG: hypothetical protein Ct9H300mP12_11060 [Acidimicrobiales bacterium]